jgi:hypothetical protein
MELATELIDLDIVFVEMHQKSLIFLDECFAEYINNASDCRALIVFHFG